MCPNCNGVRWVCDGPHEKPKPWAGITHYYSEACECGSGIPCPQCNSRATGTVLKTEGKEER